MRYSVMVDSVGTDENSLLFPGNEIESFVHCLYESSVVFEPQTRVIRFFVMIAHLVIQLQN